MDAGGEFNFAAIIAEDDGIAIGNAEVRRVIRMDENRRLAFAFEASRGLVEAGVQKSPRWAGGEFER